MRGDENGTAVFLRNIHENFSHNAHAIGVKTVDRLIENEQGRIPQQCHCNADSLLHAQGAGFEFEMRIVLHTYDL